MAGVYITGIGMITPLGNTCAQTLAALGKNRVSLSPLSLFFHPNPPLTGQIRGHVPDPGLPRTHSLAVAAGKQAVAAGGGKIPDAVVMGVTTGGMAETEQHLKNGVAEAHAYTLHGLDTVARCVAAACGCTGPVLTVSTACSSGTAAVALAFRMIQAGMAQCVLAGGADALCRLTCHGFAALQLIDPNGARPFDAERRGMHLSEAAALVLLQKASAPPAGAAARVLGAGLSCDAHHATSPDPEGRGAARAMMAALADAAIEPADIDYINLHGTGTITNDAAEALAVHAVFGPEPPALSSVKGATGHSLAAAGAVEAAVCARVVADGFVPANSGMRTPDPALRIRPLSRPRHMRIQTLLSNSFGFGGNNAALVLGDINSKPGRFRQKPGSMGVVAGVCATGAGGTKASLEAFCRNRSCAGQVLNADLCPGLDPKSTRRLKRLSRMVLSLADEAVCRANARGRVSDLFFGTGWGALTETHDFLTRLFANQERLSSPMDFAGSVHNAPAGQAALALGARGANMTLTGEHDAFEQALLAAWLMGPENTDPFLVLGADEAHATLSPLFDPFAAPAGTLADGGGGLVLTRADTGVQVRPWIFPGAGDVRETARAVIARLGGAGKIARRFGVIFAGIPAAHAPAGRRQIAAFLDILGINLPIVDYRQYTGHFATASAAAAGLAAGCMEKGFIDPALCQGMQADLAQKGILLLNAGRSVTAVEMFRT